MDVCFANLMYAKRPYTLYVDEKEYNEKITKIVASMTVYHQTQHGPFYVGHYRYKSTYNGIVTLRKLPWG